VFVGNAIALHLLKLQNRLKDQLDKKSLKYCLQSDIFYTARNISQHTLSFHKHETDPVYKGYPSKTVSTSLLQLRKHIAVKGKVTA